MENLAAQISSWTIYKKIAFRFAFTFFILFILFLDYYSNFFTNILYEFAQLYELSDIAVYWAGKHLFHIPYTIIKPVWGDHSDSTYILFALFPDDCCCNARGYFMEPVGQEATKL
ncbi:MAG: hypothetical protein KBF35_10885 [Saprospiraceae bacterium]|jgi:hypothetical protein|nr:hypothetical protein [Saprospiraceae bacterium]